jgi:AraC-like DNA-binding protein
VLLAHDTFRRLCLARELLAGDEPLAIKDVARHAGISPFHFIRQYEALFGETPHQFRIRTRLDRAKVLLARGNHSVTGVCMEVGFSSLGSFSDLFTRRVGEPPSVYQRRARIIVPVGELPPPLFPGCLNLMAAAFSQFSRSTSAHTTLECGYANQAHQHHGRRPG